VGGGENCHGGKEKDIQKVRPQGEGGDLGTDQFWVGGIGERGEEQKSNIRKVFRKPTISSGW